MSSSLVGLIHHMAFVKLQFDASKAIDEWNKRHTNPKSLIRTYKVFPKIRFSGVVLSLKTKNCNKIAAFVCMLTAQISMRIVNTIFSLMQKQMNISSETGGPCSSENTSNFWSSENRDLSRWFQSVKLHAWSVKQVRRTSPREKQSRNVTGGHAPSYSVRVDVGWAEIICLEMPKTCGIPLPQLPRLFQTTNLT